MGEWIFILICVIIFFFAAQRLRKFRTTKTEIIVSLVSCIFLTIMFLIPLVDHFNYRELILFCVFELILLFSLYKKYQKYKRDNNPQIL